MDKPIEIGLCKGCNRRFRLDGGVCRGCLEGPNRGRKWADMSYRVRNDREFALTVYNSIKNNRGKKLFELMYGVPPGAICTSNGAILYLVTDEERVAAVMEA